MTPLSLVLVTLLAGSTFAGLVPEHAPLAYAHAPVHYALPPPISTFSFISLNHHKPTSYSGFTNHGRGYLDPGYSVQYRQDGYALPSEHHYY